MKINSTLATEIKEAAVIAITNEKQRNNKGELIQGQPLKLMKDRRNMLTSMKK